MLKRLIPLALCGPLIAITACTPREIASWVEWNNQDPGAAQAFANQPEVQADLASGEHEQQSNAAAVTNGGRWDRIARCESGGNWSYPPVTNRTGTYSGGLMIWQKAWISYGGQQYAGWAYQATKAQQIAVAERIWADNGPGAWDCK